MYLPRYDFGFFKTKSVILWISFCTYLVSLELANFTTAFAFDIDPALLVFVFVCWFFGFGDTVTKLNCGIHYRLSIGNSRLPPTTTSNSAVGIRRP